MLKKLTTEQLQHYREDGYVAPVNALAPAKAAEYRRRMEACEKAFGSMDKSSRGSRSHLLFQWAADLVREPGVLDAVEDLIGPDILIYSLTIWLKEPGEPNFVSWHQDSTYHSLDCESVGCWIALSDASVEAGCMEVIPASHRLGQLTHDNIVDANNMLPRGQTVTRNVDFSKTSFMPLQPGQLSLHDAYLVHRSGPNNSQDRRIGVAANFIPARGRCTSSVKLMASLVRGNDRFGHFDLEPMPKTDYDEEARRVHAEALRRYAEMKRLMPAS